MSIFWRGGPYDSYSRTLEELYALELEEWVVHTWKRIDFVPLNRNQLQTRHQLPLLPGIYSVYGKFQASHLAMLVLRVWKDYLSTRKDFPNGMVDIEKPSEFNAFIYIGSSKSLFGRWEAHDKMWLIQKIFFNNGVDIDLYFYAMPPIERKARESEAECASRLQLEGKMIFYLCPILNGPRVRKPGVKH